MPAPTMLVNLANPLTAAQMTRIAALLGYTLTVRACAAQMDRSRPLAEVARELVDVVGLTAEAWQTRPLIANPPGLAPLAVGVVAELHGRCGSLLPILHLCPVTDSLLARYEVAEIVGLPALREQAQTRRQEPAHAAQEHADA